MQDVTGPVSGAPGATTGPRRIAFFGGIYSNYLSLDAAIAAARARGATELWALGDFGAFGPHPDRACELLRREGVSAIQGNYEESLSSNATDCHCGYVDPRDNHYAQLSYDYTAAKTSAAHKAWMATLPKTARVTIGGVRLLLCHGSPRRINEFLWRSTTPIAFVERLLREHDADVIVCTHTGIHWSRLHAKNRGIINVGALGRPANDGDTAVWFAMIEEAPDGIRHELVRVEYDHERLAREMEEESLPAEFVETIRTGWWTTCLEILPAKERAAGRY
ncbi:metallophosphatase family protein [Myxococcota bacterium]|nr:metallophosphatase family protein [Myxococcota bacterium]